MKVTFLTGSLSRQAGGFLPILQRSARELTEHGCEVTAFGIDDADFAADRPDWHCRETRVFPALGPARLSYSRALGAALRAHDADLLHLHGLWMGVSALNHRWHRRTGRPYLISAHGMLDRWALRHRRWKKRLVGALYENRNLRDAACLHALSAQEVEDFRSYGLRNPVAVIPNGVDLPTAAPGKLPPPWSEFAPAGSRILLFLGRLHAKKGILELLDGWQSARIGDLGWRLVLAGWDDGGHEADIVRRIAGLRLDREVKLIGPQFGDAKRACLENAHAFVLTSHSEGLPVAVLEAWAHRLPALLTPACNLPCGFAAEAALRVEAEADSISRGLQALAAMSDEARTAMGSRARELVERSFTWPSITRRMLATYRWMLGQGECPPFIEN